MVKVAGFVFGVLILTTSCEQCSVCEIAQYETVCDCSGFFGNGSRTEEIHTEAELNGVSSNCFVRGCSFSKTLIGTTDEEVCNNENELEEEIADREERGWDCSTPSS
jgi:hypothetical protein